MTYDDIPCLVDIQTREDLIDYAASIAEDGMVFVELGCYLGGSIARLAYKIKERDIKAQVFAIDDWICANISDQGLSWSSLNSREQVYNSYLSNIAMCGLKDYITTIVSDSILAAQKFEDNSVDYIFFDASHGVDNVQKELLAWIPKLKEKSLAALHDWPDEYVKAAVIGICGTDLVPIRGGNSVWIRKTL